MILDDKSFKSLALCYGRMRMFVSRGGMFRENKLQKMKNANFRSKIHINFLLLETFHLSSATEESNLIIIVIYFLGFHITFFFS